MADIRLILLILLTFLLNLPFGYWRGSCRKFSWQWFVAIHLPVILLYFIRKYLHVERNWITLLLLILMFFTGQRIGAFLHKKKTINNELT